MRRYVFGIACGIVALAPHLAMAASVDISFSRITNNADQNIASQLVVTAKTVDGNSSVVDFVFKNLVGINSSVREIYFDNGATSSLFSAGSIAEQVGTAFVYGASSPPNLPGGSSMAETFSVTPGFLADAQGHPSKGINTSADMLRFRLTLLGGVDFNDVLAALASGDLRIGMHVGSIGAKEDSDSFVNDPIPAMTPMPMPTPALLGAAGLSALAMTRRRR